MSVYVWERTNVLARGSCCLVLVPLGLTVEGENNLFHYCSMKSEF